LYQLSITITTFQIIQPMQVQELNLTYRRESQYLPFGESVGTREKGIAALVLFGGIHNELRK